jgi:regulator of replication initiation timing
MSWFDKIGRLFKTVVAMDQKITQLVDVIKRLDAENRQLRERVAKLEALAMRRDAEGKNDAG